MKIFISVSHKVVNEGNFFHPAQTREVDEATKSLNESFIFSLVKGHLLTFLKAMTTALAFTKASPVNLMAILGMTRTASCTDLLAS